MLPKTTRDQDKDTGLLLCLILMALGVYTGRPALLPLAMALLLAAMVWPGLFRPLARPWFGLAHLLGSLGSKVVLTLIFFVVVTPMGLLRRAIGKDAMRLRAWKGGQESALVERNHRYTAADLERPY